MEKEWQLFLCSALYGAELLLVYDLIRSIRNTWKHGKILIAVGDIFFWMAASIFLFVKLYGWNHGILRWYFFLGLFLGMLLYAVTIGPCIVKFVSFLLKRLKMFFSWVKLIIRESISKTLILLGINNGENGKTEKTQTACEEADQTE